MRTDSKARALHERFRLAAAADDQRRFGALLATLLHDWLIEHILKEDMRLKPYLLQAKVPTITVHTGMPRSRPEEARQQRRAERDRDLEYQLPPQFAHLLERLDYTVPQLPPPQGGFATFDELCLAAINRRIDAVLVFFQRHNPDILRELPPPFLTSPEFAGKFHLACERLIFPAIRNSRQIRLLSTNFEWAEANSASFWTFVDRQLQAHILDAWTAAWNELRLVEVRRPDGTRVMQVKEGTKELRELLAPSTSEAYDLPKLGNREIDAFQSLFDPANDWWGSLNQIWQMCHDLYEQEKDPRIFQMKAREGALRDNLLALFGRFPDQWADFLVLACHRVFPRISTAFLESFTANLGRTDEQRAQFMPYTVRYIQQAREHPGIRVRESREEADWRTQMQQLRDHLAGRPAEDTRRRASG